MKLSPNLTNLLWICSNGKFHPTSKWKTQTLASALYRGYIEYNQTEDKICLSEFGKRIHRRLAGSEYESWKSCLHNTKVRNFRSKKLRAVK